MLHKPHKLIMQQALQKPVTKLPHPTICCRN